MNTMGSPRASSVLFALWAVALATVSAPAHAQGIQPTTATLRLDTGGLLNFTISVPGPNNFQFARLCKDIQATPGLAFRPDPCIGAAAAAPVLFAQTGPDTFQATISAAALAATVSSGPLRPRFTHLVVSVQPPFLPQNYAVVRITLSEPVRGPELTEMQLRFVQAGARRAFGFFELDQVLPPVEALLRFTGGGLLRARWEVVTPGDPQPSAFDLTPGTCLSPEDRARQYRWRLLSRVQTYLSATGLTRIAGPDPRLLPTDRYGAYSVLLRIEPLSPSDPASGTQAPVLLPVLRYFVGDSAAPVMQPEQAPIPIELMAPRGLVFDNQPLVFSWQAQPGVALYRLEVQRDGRSVYAARVSADTATGTARFEVPAFARPTLGRAALRWRVVSWGSDGQALGASAWADLQVAAVR